VENSEAQLSACEVDARARLFDHGYVDSLSAASLLAFIDQRYHVEISEVDLVGRLSSLDALARHIQEVARAPD
jgi:acyl carrier protein